MVIEGKEKEDGETKGKNKKEKNNGIGMKCGSAKTEEGSYPEIR